MAPELPSPPRSIGTIGAMAGASDIELAPEGRRGRAIPAPEPDDDGPPPMVSMFSARTIGRGNPTAPTKANAELRAGASNAPCVPIGAALPLLLPPIGMSTLRSESMLLRRSCG